MDFCSKVVLFVPVNVSSGVFSLGVIAPLGVDSVLFLNDALSVKVDVKNGVRWVLFVGASVVVIVVVICPRVRLFVYARVCVVMCVCECECVSVVWVLVCVCVRVYEDVWE